MTGPTLEQLDMIGAAFNANDIDAVMAFFAEDAVFDHAIGPEAHGLRFEGATAIRAAFAGLFEKVMRVEWVLLDHAVSGHKAYCTYRRTAAYPDGRVDEVLSVDVLTFRGGLIVHKDTYFKERTA